jgi:hypothetical protein
LSSRARWTPFLFVLTASCGDAGDQPSFALQVDPPASTECIGVVGFEVTASAAARSLGTETVLGVSPVLTREGCRLASPIAFGDVDPDSPLDIQVSGFDGAFQLLVSGSAHLPSLRHPEGARVALRGAGVAGRPVMVMNRTVLFGAVALSEVQTMDVRTQPTNVTLLNASITQPVRPFFSVGEPTAIALQTAPAAGDDVVITLTYVQGQRSVHASVTPDPSGLYLNATPR